MIDHLADPLVRVHGKRSCPKAHEQLSSVESEACEGRSWKSGISGIAVGGRPYRLFSKWNDALGTDQALGGEGYGLGVWDSAWVMDTA